MDDSCDHNGTSKNGEGGSGRARRGFALCGQEGGVEKVDGGRQRRNKGGNPMLYGKNETWKGEN